jgi:type IV secretory pathway VirB2 component (pilin)
MALTIESGGQSSPALAGAAHWIEGALLGGWGTSLAVLAVAWLGFGMLTGTLSLRRSGLLVLGCAIMFSAPTLARSLLGLARPAAGGNSEIAVARPVPPPLPKTTPPIFDPYAGAAVPSSGN